jgi:hypothetical protein
MPSWIPSWGGFMSLESILCLVLGDGQLAYHCLAVTAGLCVPNRLRHFHGIGFKEDIKKSSGTREEARNSLALKSSSDKSIPERALSEGESARKQDSSSSTWVIMSFKMALLLPFFLMFAALSWASSQACSE